MKKYLVSLVVLIAIFFSSSVLAVNANEKLAFGPGFNVTFGDNAARINGMGMMNGSHSQGYIPFPITNISLKSKEINLKEYEKGLFVVELNTKDHKLILEPCIVEGLATNQQVFQATKAQLVVNAGFFDPKNKKTISYIVYDGKVIANPEDNENLTSNPELAPNLDKIYNRTEFRILKNNGNFEYDIAPHNAVLKDNRVLIHSLQGGPELLPELKLEEEFFVVIENEKVVRNSISAYSKVPRTVIGVKNDCVYLIIASVDKPMTIEELRDFCKKLKLEKAMCFDGGGSTSLNYKNFEIISEKNNSARRLKSFLIVK